MHRDQAMIEIDGREAADLYADLNRIDVELDEELAAMFVLELSMHLQPDGTWSHVDDDRFAPWRRVTIHAGFQDGTEPLMTGYLTHAHAVFDADPAKCRLELWGMDGSVLMDRQERLRDWPDHKDSDIAAAVFAEYGLKAEVEDTAVVHDARTSTIMQRETDIQFLRRLALRNGFECFVEGDTGHFRAPRADADPQPVLAAHFGAETNMDWFTVRIDALTDSRIGMFQLHRTEKQVLSSLAETSRQPALGARRPGALLPPGLAPARAFVGMNVVTGAKEMEVLCQSLLHRGEWFVTGEGLVSGNRYGSVLRARRPVTIKGVGETHSGVYHVAHVTHSISPAGYHQRFKVKRNAVLPTGDERFGDSSALALPGGI
ncbi:phage late control D family protein [Thermomonospora amylolytica]|uniref:phage late control D family protein n=1 Tax=Thermomonospora amylolytica TaxID=1411117 RepID=UPI000E6CBE46|nr:contractile injection system protein, VgrG/Pvc8 family [Thermomonospora amylolytica]